MPITVFHERTETALMGGPETWNGSTHEAIMSVTVPTGANFLAVVFAGAWTGYTVFYNGIPLSLSHEGDDSNTQLTRFFYLVNPPVGTFNLTTNSASTSQWRATAVPMGGVDTTNPIRSIASVTTSSTNPVATATTIAGDVVLGVCSSVEAIINNANNIVLNNVVDSVSRSTSYRYATGTSTTLSWTFLGGFNTQVAAAIRPATNGETLLFQDDFTDTDAVVLSAHVPTIAGVSWTSLENETNATISGNRFDSPGGYATTTYQANGSDTFIEGYAQLEMYQADESGGDNYVRLQINYQDVNNYYFVEWATFTSFREVKLFKRSAGTNTQLGTTYSTGALTNLTPYPLRITRSGNDLSVMFNGEVVIGPITDSSPINVASHAIVHKNSQNGLSDIDNFMVVSTDSAPAPSTAAGSLWSGLLR